MKINGFDDKYNICGARIEQICKQKKVTQAELAARLQVRSVTVNALLGLE